MRSPLIGITPTPSLDELAHGTFRRYVLNADYATAVLAAGGIPVILPYQDSTVSDLVDRLDGLLLSGGADIDPIRFGDDAVHLETYGVTPARDEFELRLVHDAVRRDLPILGICRGIQVLNVALGGTLIQDIPSQYQSATPLEHRQQKHGIPTNQPGHDVAIVDNSLLHDRIGVSTLPVNSFHHQAIARLATDLVAVAHAGDGLIEAVELPGRRFVLGVQWHPELMFAGHPTHLMLFKALVDAARIHHEQSATVSIG